MGANAAVVRWGHSEGLVIGKVLEVRAPDRERAPDVLVVLDESNPKYPTEVACDFTERHRDKLNGLGPGDYVKVVGAIRSKEYKGRYYTNFVAYSLARVGGEEAAPPPTRRAQHREVGADDDIPF